MDKMDRMDDQDKIKRLEWEVKNLNLEAANRSAEMMELKLSLAHACNENESKSKRIKELQYRLDAMDFHARIQYAASALTGYLSSAECRAEGPEVIAKSALIHADALIEAMKGY
jgi:hypothetical protein